MSSKVLVTGGAGYLGSHTVLALLERGYDVAVLDNLTNSSKESLDRVMGIAGKKVDFLLCDICDESALDNFFARNSISAVLHFAGLKSVNESVSKPIDYYINNFGGTLSLCRSMSRAKIFRLVFSSSATVYGLQSEMPISEKMVSSGPTNPYGLSKFFAEQFLQDLVRSNEKWNIAILRYFNPGGAHVSGLIGENPSGLPNNLLPYVSQVASGKLPALKIFGKDYETRDGTGLRDYIHVMDLAEGHLSALSLLEKGRKMGVWNLGTGVNHSVLEVVQAFEEVIGCRIPYVYCDRRVGDVGECWADVSLAEKELFWTAKRSLKEILTDAWRWQSCNPDGYK